MAKRSVFHSVPSKDGWRVTQSKETVSVHKTQKEAEAAATAAGRAAEQAGGKGQAVLHKADGTIREERTYGADPTKTPG